MCGVCGVYSPTLDATDISVFKKLLLINQLRGQDSTGVAIVHADRKLTVLKGVGHSGHFLKSKEAKEFISVDAKPMVLMGHCRAATIGFVNRKNAHPFSFKNVVGAMNGTFYGTFPSSELYETDSEAIFFNINKAIEEGRDPIEGINDSMVYTPKFALTYVNKKDNTINFIRNSERPLHFAYIKNRQTLVWSSTSEHLEFVLDEIEEVPYTGWKQNDKDCFTLKEHDLLSITIGKPATKTSLVGKEIKKKVWTGAGNSYSNPMTEYYMGMGYEYDGYDNDDTVSNGSSKVLMKCPDGQYRSKEAERKRLDTFRTPNTGSGTSGTSSGKKDNSSASGKSVKRKETGRDLSTLSWLKAAEADSEEEQSKRLEKFERAALAKTDSRSDLNRPQSVYELKHQLKCGCMACGKDIDPDDYEEVSRIRWWSREAWACGDCYEFSDGDWVRCSIEDNWDPVPKSIAIH